MNILIVTTSKRCIAYQALKAEGYEAHVVLIDPRDQFAYGKALSEWWQNKEGFINIEHDMAPWEGAVAELEGCDKDLCVFGYPRAPTGSLGMIKFRATLIEQFPHADDRWDTTWWSFLEQAVLGYFKNVEKHQHYPGIAHVSGWYR